LVCTIIGLWQAIARFFFGILLPYEEMQQQEVIDLHVIGKNYGRYL
jgi:hypothetical protein